MTFVKLVYQITIKWHINSRKKLWPSGKPKTSFSFYRCFKKL